MNMSKTLLPLCLVALVSAPVCATGLTIAENGKSDYEIVVPDKGQDAFVDHWLLMTAKLMQAAFETNGFRLAVVQEGGKTPDKPGIYLGATAFARKHGVKVDLLDDWTYYTRAVGRDLIIVGKDRTDPAMTVRKTKTPLALLGTVKGACDFLREYAGVRFLFVNMDQSQYTMRGDGADAFNKDGSLKIDTRSIAFTPAPKIAVPDRLDVKKTPMMRANSDAGYETFYYIAMNFFPPLSDTEGGNVSWHTAIPAPEYAGTHPEYFALTKDGKRAFDLRASLDARTELEYCVANKGVQDLMYKAAETLITNGAKTISISTMDGFQLCRCNCDACNRLFGMKAESMDQIYARGRSGKLWQVFFAITERLRRKYPEAKVVLLNYQDTPISADVIREFPKNVIVKIQFASQLDFDRLKGVTFPAGICGFEETFTGFGQAGPYVPERTPEHIAGVVQAMARNNVRWSKRDGSIGYVRGMQAPAYYVYGRMMDDPDADWTAIHREFCEAAFGNTASQMTGFFDLLHMQMAIYSDFFGVMMPAWNRKYSRSRYHDSKWHVMSMYTPEYCAAANALLTSAEKAAKDPDVKARLHLIRIEFDYIRKMAGIFFLQNVWTLNPTQANLDELVDAIDDWHADLERLAGGTGRSGFKPLSDWPEMRPFNGHFYSHAALEQDLYQQQWASTCLNWDTKAIRAGILTDKHQLSVASVDEAPGIDSPAWARVPESFLRERGGMPFINVKTTLKVLRDKDNLYVRVEGLHPSQHPEDIFKREPDGDIFKQEYVELGLLPPAGGGKIYRLAANPVEASHYDSVFTPDTRNRMTEDVKWNGGWEFAFTTSLEKGPYTLPARVWTGWFKIPFAALGAKAPVAGEAWGFNAARGRTGQYMLWSDARSVTDPEALGKLTF